MSQLFLLGKVAGILMLVAGLVLNFIISKRRFNRRSITGIQVYRSYEHSLTTRWAERIGRFIAISLILIGIMVLLGSIMVPSKIK